jgi:hypothetical protein
LQRGGQHDHERRVFVDGIGDEELHNAILDAGDDVVVEGDLRRVMSRDRLIGGRDRGARFQGGEGMTKEPVALAA